MKEGSQLDQKLIQPVLRLMNEKKYDSLANEAWEKQSVIHVDISVKDGVEALGSLPDKAKNLTFQEWRRHSLLQRITTPRRNGAFVLAFGRREKCKI